ncbi:thyroid adenoma-associated protein homolog [Tetranychus urticae]|uniref:thyroid adenoma-associated protein homolog n=1 Tax=Tetranychus urticae TaxID=32264 RepID=UPI00077BA43A|nr:thyroid adenoma-associated protein homolog [Tetranychus urticae]
MFDQDPINQRFYLHQQSIFHYDESIRVQTLGMLLENPKLSNPIPPEYLEIIKDSLNIGLTIQEPCNRQRFLVLMDKMFKRMKCSLEYFIRRKEEGEEFLFSSYKSFVISTLEICFNSLYIDGYFARRTLSLELIQMVIVNFANTDYFAPKDIFLTLGSAKSIYVTLMNCLIEDSLEETKQLVINVLAALVEQNVIFLETTDIDFIRDKAFQMLSNINPLNVISASYLFRCLTKLISLDDLSQRVDINLELLNILVSQVEISIKETQSSILDGAVYNPIHSRLSSIHGLIESLDSECFNLRKPDWSQLMEKIGTICFDASETVSCIVCNDSPEGFLPMDLKPLDDEMVNKIVGRENLSSPIIVEKRRDITSQMLLIFGWKTIKEAALMLGKICEKIDHTLDNSVINCSFVGKVLNYFVHHLKELKHRGAFEQAYTGFSMVVKCIWRKPCSCLKVIENLLDEILKDLANENEEANGPKCITRRSAGLPFVTQAIVSSEPKDNRNRLLSHVINNLIKICSSESAEDWQKVHCLNVLRALIRDKRLGERVDTFIEDCLKLCLSHFDYSSYSVSNSASILFSALMIRIFGVNHSKDHYHKKNSMSPHQFFLRYPSMCAFISENIHKTSTRTVLPTLLIILRLWPTIQETNCLLLPYREPLKSLCFQSNVAKIRDLSGQALAQVISAEEKLIAETVEYLSSDLNKPDLPVNHRDGLISFLYHFVRCHVKQIETDNLHHRLISSLTQHTSELLVSLNSTNDIDIIGKPLYSYNRFVTTVEILLEEQLINPEDQIICDLYTILSKLLTLFEANPRTFQFASSQDFFVKLIHFTLYCSPFEARNKVISTLLSPSLPVEMIHLRTIIFKFLTYSLAKDLDTLEVTVRDEIMNDFELNITEPDFDTESQIRIIEPIEVMKFISSCSEYKCLLNNDSLTTFQPLRNLQQLFYLLHCALARLESQDLTNWNSLFDTCFSLFEQLEPSGVVEDTLALFYLVLSDIWDHQITVASDILLHEKLNQFCVSVISICTIDRSDLSRKIAVLIVGKLLPTLIKTATTNKASKVYLPSISSLWQTIPNLLQDNSPAIRDFTATMCNDLTDFYFTPTQIPKGDLLNRSFQLLSSVFSDLDEQDSLRRVLLDLINGQKTISDNDDEQERFFDKSKINFVEDPVQLILIAKSYLEPLINQVDCNLFHSTLQEANKSKAPVIKLSDYFGYCEMKIHNLMGQFLVKLSDANLALEVHKALIIMQLWIRSKPICDECSSAMKNMKETLETCNYEAKVIFSIASEIRLLKVGLNC